jgi:hypothetical protein
MPRRRGNDGAAAVLAIAGLGVLVAAAIASGGSSDRRSSFIGRLRQRLSVRGISLITADFGRVDQVPTWILTLQLPNQHVATLHAPVEHGADAFSNETCDQIVERVAQRVL